jgi:membrane protein required for colicin V production
MITGLKTMYAVNQMIWIDYAITGLVFIYLVIGLARGGGKEILSLLSWFLALGVGWCFALEFSDLLTAAIKTPPARIAVSFACLLVITRIFTSFILFLMTEGITRASVTFTGHFFGMLVGAIRGLVIVAAIILTAGLTNLPKDLWWRESKLIPPFQSSAVWLRDTIPSGIAGYIRFR